MAIATTKDAEEMTLFMAHVLDSLQASVVVCDSDLRIVAINAGAWKVLNRLGPSVRAAYDVDVAQLIGMPLCRFLPDRPRLEAILRDPALLPHCVEGAFGSMNFQARIDALRAPQGEIAGYAVVCEDVSRLRAAEEERDAALRQRATLLHEVRRRVRSSLRLVADLARLESGAAPEWAARLRALARVHERVYASDDVSRVDLDAYVRGLVQDAVDANPSAARRISIETAVHAHIGDTDQLIAFGAVISELVANAIQHGFPDGRAGRIRVSAQSVGGGVEAVVSDDGAGLGAPGSGRGLKIACALVEKRLKGELRIESGCGGTACLFSIPSEAAAERRVVMGSLRSAAATFALHETH